MKSEQLEEIHTHHIYTLRWKAKKKKIPI